MSGETRRELSAWDHVQLARQLQRPHTLDYIHGLCTDWIELHGDRRFGDDPAIIGGIAAFACETVVVLGHQRGHDTRENIRRNFGMPHPEGYRKALRLMRHAERFGFPVLCFVDTPGAFPNRAAEERGQATAIAENIAAMCGLRTPVVSVVIGQGGSGGALAIGVADTLIMLEHAVYCVASPEASAAILWHDAARASDAARALKITAQDLFELGVADLIVPEPEGGAHVDASAIIAAVGTVLRQELARLRQHPIDALLRRRYHKYRSIGCFHDAHDLAYATGDGLAGG
jgi:acetyl-CoA carboxylase carboxyl transferase subunit alpha